MNRYSNERDLRAIHDVLRSVVGTEVEVCAMGIMIAAHHLSLTANRPHVSHDLGIGKSGHLAGIPRVVRGLERWWLADTQEK